MKRVALLLVAAALCVVPMSGIADDGWEVVVTGLNNPRGLNFGPDGALYVAEAGSGGQGACLPDPDSGAQRCFGRTGSIARIDVRGGTFERVATGLPSLSVDTRNSTGPHDISFPEWGFGVFSIGYGGDPSQRVGVGRQFDKLSRLLYAGKTTAFKDLGAAEVAKNPDGAQVDSNPYGVLALPGKQIVADAGANALLEVREDGQVKTLAVFPDRMVPAPPFLGLPPGAEIPMDAVPTTVALGPDGAYYVGQLTGFPFPVGGAAVYRVPARGGTPLPWAIGFTNIIDIAFGKDGSLYVLELTKKGLLVAGQTNDYVGAILRVRPNGSIREIASEGLIAPGGIAIARNGTIYVTNHSTETGVGEVLRLQR